MTPWTVARQAPLSMGFSRQEYWNGLPLPSPEDFPEPRIELRSPALQVDFFFLPSACPGKPLRCQKAHESRHIVTSAEIFIFILTTFNASSYFIYVYIHIYRDKKGERVFTERSEVAVTRVSPRQPAVPFGAVCHWLPCASLWKCCSQQATARMPFLCAELLARDFKAENRSPELEGISIWDQ